MKKAALAALLISAPLFAQENTLFHGKMEHGGFGGPVWKMDMVSGEARIFTGGRGGWIINHTVVLGGGGYSMISDMKTDLTYEESPLFMRMDYSGFEIEYITNSDRVVHWTLYMLLGGGTVYLKKHNPDDDVRNDGFYLLNPQLNLELNVTGWFRLNLGAGYRIPIGLDLEGIKNNDIGGLSTALVLKFGKF